HEVGFGDAAHRRVRDRNFYAEEPRDAVVEARHGVHRSGDERQVQVATYRAGVERHRSRAVDGPLRPPLERLFHADAAFHAGQRRTETEVDLVAEGEVKVERAVE